MHPVLSSNDWLIEETHFDFAEANFKETIFTVGNGYQGTRGSLEEGHKGELSGTYLAGVYDHHDSTVIDQVNAPTWLPLKVGSRELLTCRPAQSSSTGACWTCKPGFAPRYAV